MIQSMADTEFVTAQEADAASVHLGDGGWYKEQHNSC